MAHWGLNEGGDSPKRRDGEGRPSVSLEERRSVRHWDAQIAEQDALRVGGAANQDLIGQRGIGPAAEPAASVSPV